jgi:hypothetical protein
LPERQTAQLQPGELTVVDFPPQVVVSPKRSKARLRAPNTVKGTVPAAAASTHA